MKSETSIQSKIAFLRASGLYDIHFRRAGVGLSFFEPPHDHYDPATDADWRRYIKLDRYYATFMKAVEAEYQKRR